jgi:DNA repair exonuclease SbcCD ATPase subunit
VKEAVASGNRRKDMEANVERYARLGIAEYFVFDRGRMRLFGYRLPSPGARAYKPILPQFGFYTSQVLGLDLRIDGLRLRFYHAAMVLPDANELIRSLERVVDDVEQRMQAADERATEAERLRADAERLRDEAESARAEEARLRVEEARLRAEAEKRLAEALAENERLKAKRGAPR